MLGRMRRCEALAGGLGVAAEDFDQIERGWLELENRTARLSAERALYAEFFAAAPEASLLTDACGVIRDINRTGIALLNASFARLIGKPLAVFIVMEARSPFRRMLARLALDGSGSGCAWDSVVQPRGKASVPVHVRARTAQGPGGLWLVIRPS